jgi:hypothetical protein
MAGRSEITPMTDEDLFFEIPGETPPAAAPPPPPAATAPPPAPPEPAPPARPPPPSAPADPPAPRPRNRRLTLALSAIGGILVVAILVVLSFSVSIGPSSGNATYPYTVTYDVVFPAAEQVQIGNITLVALPYPDRVSLWVDGVTHDILLNQTREVSAKRATVTLIGLPLLSFDFTLEAEYQGMVGQDASFGLSVRTSEQIPKFLIDRLVPARVQAWPA